MSRKEISYSSLPQLFNGASMTGSATLTSNVTNVMYRDSVAIQLQWSGTPNGTFYVQGSLDYNPGTPQSEGGVNAGTWTTVPVVDVNNNPPVASGSAGSILINMNQVAFPWLRVQYTNSSSTGTLTGYVGAKSLG
jgi:hypothetical protein